MAEFPAQGDTSTRNVWGTLLRNFFTLTYNLATGYFKDPWIDTRSYATIALADTAAIAAGKPLLVAENITVSTAMTITSPVIVEYGGGFTHSTGGTLTFNGAFKSVDSEVFTGFDIGDVTFGKGTVTEVNVLWFGAVGDGVTDDYTAIASAISAANGNAKVAFPVPASFWSIGTGLTLTSSDHLYFYGVNAVGGSLVNYIKPTSAVSSAITTLETIGVTIDGLGLNMASMANGSVGLDLTADWSMFINNTHIYGQTGSTTKGIKLSTQTGSSRNSSIWNSMKNVSVWGASEANNGWGFYIDDQNTKNIGWVMDSCRAVNMGVGMYLSNVSSSMVFISFGAESSTSHGIDVATVSSGAQVNFIGGEISGNDGWGVNVTSASRLVIDGAVMSTNGSGDVNFAAATEGQVRRIRQNVSGPILQAANSSFNRNFIIVPDDGTTKIKHTTAANQILSFAGYEDGPNYWNIQTKSSDDPAIDIESMGTATQAIRWGIDNWSDGSRFYLYGGGNSGNEVGGIGFYDGTLATSTNITAADQYGRLSALAFKPTVYALTLAATVSINARNGSVFTLEVTNGDAFIMGNIANDASGDEFEFIIYNNSGGAMGAITWAGDYKVAGWSEPANTKYKTIKFRNVAGVLYQIGAPSADL